MENCDSCSTKRLKPIEYLTPFLISLLFVLLFIILQKFGISEFSSAKNIDLGFVFLIGIIASLSTCTASVGGLVLSLSASYSKSQKKPSIPLLQFHLSRLVSFFIFGGIIGWLGTFFNISISTTIIMNLILFVIMILMGLNLLGIYSAPSLLKMDFLKIDKLSLGPIILGAISFILPCGFTQSMQFYTLTLGSFIKGATTMLVFALGTLPLLAGISIASVKLSKSLNSEIFFKVTGFLVFYFAIFNLYQTFKLLGLL